MAISALDAATPVGFLEMLEDLCKNDRKITVDDAVRLATTLRAAVVDIASDMSDAELRSARIGAVTASSSYADRAVDEKRGGSIQGGLGGAAAATITALAAKMPDLAAHPYMAATVGLLMSAVAIGGAARAVSADRWASRVAQPMEYIARVLDDEARRRRGAPEANYRTDSGKVRVDPADHETYPPEQSEHGRHKR